MFSWIVLQFCAMIIVGLDIENPTLFERIAIFGFRQIQTWLRYNSWTHTKAFLNAGPDLETLVKFTPMKYVLYLYCRDAAVFDGIGDLLAIL